MAKQNKSTDPSEAALSAIEHALGLYGAEKAEAEDRGETVGIIGKPEQADGLHLPRVEDEPLLPPSASNTGAISEAEQAANTPVEMPNPAFGQPQKSEETSNTGAPLAEEAEITSGDTKTEATPVETALAETTLGLVPIKLPGDRGKPVKTGITNSAETKPNSERLETSWKDRAGSQPATASPQVSAGYATYTNGDSRENRRQPPELSALERNGEETSLPRRTSVLPANDDTRASVAEMLEPLNHKPSRIPVLLAIVFSLLWCGGMFVILSQSGGLLFAADGAWRSNANGTLLLSILSIIGPVLFFFSMAALSQRSREMRVSAKVMAEVAARLAEPETTASESVFTLGQAVRREVASIGDGIERALSRAGDLESLVHGEVAALERSYAENEYKMRSLVGELSAEREAIMATAERIRLTIDAAHQGFAVDITKASSSISEAIDEAGDRVTFLIGGKQDEIVATLDRSASHAAELISMRTHELAEKLGSSTLQTEQMLAFRTQDLADKIVGASNQTIDTFSRVGGEMVEKLAITGSTITREIDTAGNQTIDTFSRIGNEVVEKLAITGSDITREIDTAGNQTIDTFSRIGNEVVEKLAITGSTISREIDTVSTLIDSKIEEQSRQLVGEIGAAGDALAERIQRTNGNIVQEWNALSSNVTDTITQASTGAAQVFRSTAEEATGAITISLARSTDILSEISTTIKQDVDGTLEKLTTTFEEKGRDILTNIAERAIEINDVVQNAGTDLFAKLEERGRDVANIMDTKASNLVESITQRAEDLATRFHSDAERLGHVLTTSTQQVEGSLEHSAVKVSDLFESHVATLDNASRQVNEALASTLSTRVAQANEAFSIAGEGLGTLIAERTQEAAKGLKANIDGLGLNLMEQSAQITRQMATNGRDLAEGMLAQATQLNDALGQNARQLSGAIQSSALDLSDRFNQFETVFVEKTKALENNVLQHGEAVGMKMVEQSEAVSTTLTSLLDRIETGLDERAKSLGDVLALRTLELSRLITESSGRLETVTTQSRETAEEAIQRAETLARTVTAKVTEINTLFDESGTRFIKGLEGHGRDLLMGLEGSVGAITTRLTISMAELNEAVANGSTASLAQLADANDQLRNEVTILLGRLGDANTLLGSIVGTTTERLGDVEGRMTDRVDRLEKALAGILSAADEGSSAVLERVEALKNSSGDLLGSGTSLASMLAERTDALQTLASQLNATQQNVGDRLLERQTAFESLATTLSARIEDVDSMLRSFAALVTEQLSTAQKQARETSSIVLEASESATSTISAQYERVRQEAGKERERTATALRQTYEQANAEMSTLLNRALEDFASTAGQVREVSADIIRDIETTRRALEAGGMDIPVQAKQATTNLKRVVQDQMRAVSELGDIVSRSGVALDVVEPRRAEPPARANSRKSAPYGAEPAPFLPEPPRPALYAQPEQPIPAPRYDTRSPAPSRNESERGGSGSWLSGMLERASEEDRAPAPPLRSTARNAEAPSGNRIEALDSLSIDIARMIDHDMAVDLWERYRRGERNVFTRRLYTLQGQDTYDEIRRRYRRDSEFRQTVDAYIQQFERLLGEVAGDDRDSSISRAYLTSETGKVYTMLAHAAGRFD